MAKKKIVVSSSLAFIAGLLGAIGASGWCCTIAGALVLSALGIASLSSYLVYYNTYFLIASVIFFLLAIIFYINYRYHKQCQTSSHKK